MMFGFATHVPGMCLVLQGMFQVCAYFRFAPRASVQQGPESAPQAPSHPQVPQSNPQLCPTYSVPEESGSIPQLEEVEEVPASKVSTLCH